MATSTLKLMRKGTTAFHNLLLLKLCVTYNIQPSWNLLVGFPGEQKEVYEKYVRDLPNLVHLYPPVGSFPVRFDRYSPYFTKAREYGLNLQPMDFYSYCYPFEKDSLKNLAYYFVDTNITAEYSTTMIRWIGKIRERVQTWISKWNGVSPAARPQLYFLQNGDSTRIFDSRFDEPIEHTLNPVTLELLQSAMTPRVSETVPRSLAHLSDLDIQKEEAILDQLGLIFRDDNRYMSLVMPGPTVEFSEN
jgi:hypothetical protein